MNYKIFTVAGGNSTALVWDVPKAKRLQISKRLLQQVEQVGFVDFTDQSLEMMGGELCINAILAAGKLFGGSGVVKTTGLVVPYTVRRNTVELTIKLNYRTITVDTVLFDGIGYVFSEKIPMQQLAKLADKYQLPAFGSISVRGNKIYPRVYVRDVNSCIDETSCGSASVAVAIVSGKERIKQPSGSTISVQNIQGQFVINAIVREVK